MKSLTLFATFEEAEASLAMLAASAHSSIPFLYEWAHGYLLITGIGSFAASITRQHIMSLEIDSIGHLGIAGSLVSPLVSSPESPLESSLGAPLEIGQVLPVRSCAKFFWHPKGAEAASRSLAWVSCPPIVTGEKGVRLISTDWPLYDSQQREELSKEFDIVDMEGYAAAYLAHTLGKPCFIYKAISDFCSHDSPSTIRKHIQQCSSLLAQTLLQKPMFPQ